MNTREEGRPAAPSAPATPPKRKAAVRKRLSSTGTEHELESKHVSEPGAVAQVERRGALKEPKISFLAVPNRKADLSGDELAALAETAQQLADVEDVRLRRSSLTFTATPEAAKSLTDAFGQKVIIEQDRKIEPLKGGESKGS